jgi:DNA-binding transcriptional ArsR family regulator
MTHQAPLRTLEGDLGAPDGLMDAAPQKDVAAEAAIRWKELFRKIPFDSYVVGMADTHEVKDPRELRALAHPGRLRLLEELALLGPATATQLSERVGDSPANCSWHLRQLARYGYVEEAGGGRGRQRPWRVVPTVRRWGKSDAAAELDVVGDVVTDLLLEREVAAVREWQHRRRQDDPRWRDAATVSWSLAWLTVEELAAINDEITAVVTRHVDRVDPSRRPEGARAVRLMAWGVPVGPVERAEDA